MKLVLLDASTLGDSCLLGFEKFGEFTCYEQTTLAQRLDHISDSDIVITNKVIIDSNIIENSPHLKLVCITATGTNNIDLVCAEKAGVMVENVSGYSTESVCQSTFSMLFQLVHQSRYYDEYIQAKKWSKSDNYTHIARPFFEIKGKRWGILGMGNIGQRVAQIASSFLCDVCYHSTSGSNLDQPYQHLPLNELLTTCDIISIHAPFNDQTDNLIAAAQLLLMKKGAILLNFGRGGIINEKDMAVALDDGNILHGTDVLLVEPMLADHPYYNVQNQSHLVITPHTAWASVQARDALLTCIYANIESYLSKIK
ncbi:MAG: D-2-hydroxyacid dehydrogenase [Psychromonas sp.]|nr:D-2-hydroxyacid dehydrogenase [Psychromonas sp.]